MRVVGWQTGVTAPRGLCVTPESFALRAGGGSIIWGIRGEECCDKSLVSRERWLVVHGLSLQGPTVTMPEKGAGVRPLVLSSPPALPAREQRDGVSDLGLKALVWGRVLWMREVLLMLFKQGP